MSFIGAIKRSVANLGRAKGSDWARVDWPLNGWQLGGDEPATPQTASRFGPVYACWSIISQEVSRVPLQHIGLAPDGGKRQILGRAPARVLRNPNPYQTRSDFLLYLARSLLSDGNAYAIATRNNRFEIERLDPMPPQSCYPHIDSATGDVYYQVGQSDIAGTDGGRWYPSRDVLHIRLFTPFNPLIGETPLVAAASPVQAGRQINRQVAAFFGNMSRPSGIIRHPRRLEESTIRRIKERFVDATTGSRAGEPVVMTEGMEWTGLTMSAVDAQLVESFRLTERQVAQVYRVPQFLLGEDAKFATVEQLTKFFINSGLGFYFDHISDSLTKFFGLPPNEEIVFDYESALLSADFEARMRGLEHATRSGVYSPNEARKREGLGPVEHGDQPRVQQQLVPLSFGMEPPQPVAPPVTDPEPEPDVQNENIDELSGFLSRSLSFAGAGAR